MIRTNSDEYFIEPLERGTQQHEENGRVHVVYRRSALLQTSSDISMDYEPTGTCPQCHQIHAFFLIFP